jgi:uncharacterized RDD family membrane protein YckC
MSTVTRVRAQPPATESLAGTGRRVLALLVDQLLALVLAAGAASIGYGIALDAVESSTTGTVAPAVGAILGLPLLVLAVVGLAQWLAEAFTGRTFGGLVLGLRTVDADTGLTVGVVRIFVRNLVLGLGSLVFGVGQFVVAASGAWDSAGRLQGWHDKVARTVVVRAGASAGRPQEPVTARSLAPERPSAGSEAPAATPGRRAAVAAADAAPSVGAPARRAEPGGAIERAAAAGATTTGSANRPARGLPRAAWAVTHAPEDDRPSAPHDGAPDTDDAPIADHVPGMPERAARTSTPAGAPSVPAASAPDAASARPGPSELSTATSHIPVVGGPAPTGRTAGAAPAPVLPEDATPSTGAPTAAEPDAAEPTLDVPAWFTAAPAPMASPSRREAPDVIAATPSWDDLAAPDASAADPGQTDGTGPGAPTAPTQRLRDPSTAADPSSTPDPWAGLVEGVPGASPAPGHSPVGMTKRATPEPDDLTVTSVPRGAGAAPASLAATAGLRLVFDTGEAFAVAGRGVVGRNPSAPEGDVAHVVPIDDPARSVSKTHLEFGVEAGALWVVDRRSTNGSVLVHPDGARERLAAGVRTAVPVGAVVEFGDRRFQVLDA